MAIVMARLLARKASGLSAINRVPQDLVDKVVEIGANGKRYCKLCGRGPYTKAGMFRHLIKVHFDDLTDLIESYKASKPKRKQHHETDMATISFKLDRELLEKLEAYTKANGLTKSEVIREALEEYLAKEGMA